MKIANNERAGQIPFGWRLFSDGNTLVQDKAEQKTIAFIRNLHDRRYSYRGICRELELNGYQPSGKAFHPQTIKNIISRVEIHSVLSAAKTLKCQSPLGA